MAFEYDPTEIAPKVVEVLRSFSLHIRKEGSHEGYGKVFDSVLDRVKTYIAENAPITMVLPAFPWKNPNLDKVIGSGPDLGEELGLSRLNDICQEISKFYVYGARLILICDIPVYNGMWNLRLFLLVFFYEMQSTTDRITHVLDVVGIPDEDAYDYGLHLRELAKEKKFSSIQFIRLMDLMGLGDGEKISKADYLALVPSVREKLMSSDYFDPSFNIETELQTNPDTKATFNGFFSRMSEDLKWGKGFDAGVAADQAAYDAEVARVVKVEMQRLIVGNPPHIWLSVTC
jgi:pyoverdine/dityrosine biosynthesis protein Dit1